MNRTELLKQLSYIQEHQGIYEYERRLYLHIPIFLNLVGEDREEVLATYSRIIKITLAYELDALSVVADLLEANVFTGENITITIPEILDEYRNQWIEALDYILYGNSELEKSLSQELLDKATDHARNAVQKYIEKKYTLS